MNLEGVRLQNIKLVAQNGKVGVVPYSFSMLFHVTHFSESYNFE